jgi:Concanavalin A-like lectin/glucanases superfamily
VIFNYGSMVVCGVANSSGTSSNIAEAFCYYGYSPDLTLYQTTHPQHIKVTTGEWHHFVFVYDGLSTRIHIDGLMQAEIPCGQLEDFDVNNLVYLGGGWGGDNYLGSLSDVAIWDRPLSGTEIIDLFSTQKQSGAFPGFRGPLPVQNLTVR